MSGLFLPRRVALGRAKKKRSSPARVVGFPSADVPLHTAEPHPGNPQPPLRKVSYAQLYDVVADLVSALLAQGLKAGDRVASYSSNCIVSIIPCSYPSPSIEDAVFPGRYGHTAWASVHAGAQLSGHLVEHSLTHLRHRGFKESMTTMSTPTPYRSR